MQCLGVFWGKLTVYKTLMWTYLCNEGLTVIIFSNSNSAVSYLSILGKTDCVQDLTVNILVQWRIDCNGILQFWFQFLFLWFASIYIYYMNMMLCSCLCWNVDFDNLQTMLSGFCVSGIDLELWLALLMSQGSFCVCDEPMSHLASPGHQQPWYWLCKIGKSWSYTRKDFNYLWHVSVEEWHKM